MKPRPPVGGLFEDPDSEPDAHYARFRHDLNRGKKFQSA